MENIAYYISETRIIFYSFLLLWLVGVYVKLFVYKSLKKWIVFFFPFVPLFCCYIIWLFQTGNMSDKRFSKDGQYSYFYEEFNYNRILEKELFANYLSKHPEVRDNMRGYKIFLIDEVEHEILYSKNHRWFTFHLLMFEERSNKVYFDEWNYYKLPRPINKDAIWKKKQGHEKSKRSFVIEGLLVSPDDKLIYTLGSENYYSPAEGLDFEEFLWALGYEKLAEQIKNHFENNEPMNKALHKLALELYKKYLVIGGMPAVVKSFVETESFLSAQIIQNYIFNEYTADMSKYADTTTSVKIRACYNSVPAQLAKENRKFQYRIVQKGGTATIFGESIEWLNFAGTVLKCQKITEGNIPIAVYAYFPDFKLYMSDVGLLTLKSRLPAELLVAENNEGNTFMGSVTENYVAQAFTANKIPLFYWKNDNTAEVDFVLQKGVDVIPVEVKRGVNTRGKSMNIFAKQYNCPYSIRISQKNFGFENGIKSVPLYAVFCVMS